MLRRPAKNADGVVSVTSNGQVIPFGAPSMNGISPPVLSSGGGGGGGVPNYSATASAAENGQNIGVSSDLLGNTVKDSVHAPLLVNNLSKPSQGDNPVLYWVHVVFAVLYILLGIFCFISALAFIQLTITLYSSFRRWNSGLSTFDIALERAVDVRVDVMVACVPFIMAIYHLLFLFGFTRKVIEDFIAAGRNPVRIFFHSVAFGLIMAATIFTCGSDHVFLFFGAWIVYALYQGAILFVEYCNPPKAGVGSNKPLTYWGPIAAALVALSALAAACIIHFYAMTHGDESRTPAYAWWILLFGHLALALHFVGYVVYVFFSFFDRYIYVEVATLIWEILYMLGTVLAFIIGWWVTK